MDTPEKPDPAHQPPPPPPRRSVKRKLSLKSAMGKIKGEEDHSNHPVFDPQDEFLNESGGLGQTSDQEARLLDLKADIVNRENLLAEKEKRLSFWELELNEREALLAAHKKLLRSKENSPDKKTAAENDSEKEALEALREELEAQEASLKEAQAMLKEREEYIEQCENELVDKSMSLTEREAQIEQREVNTGISKD